MMGEPRTTTRPRAGKSLFILLGLLAVLSIIYFSLPQSWFEVPDDKPAAAPGAAAAQPDLNAMREAAVRTPQDFEARTRYGMALASSGQSELALKEFQAALQLAPDNPAIYHNLGVFYMNANQPARADSMFQKELELLPGNGRTHYYRGIVLQMQQRFPEAASHLELATKLAPDFPEPFLALAAQLTEKRPVEFIKTQVDAYLRLGGANKGLAYHVLSRAYRPKQQYDEAIKYALLATETDPNVYPYWRNLGQIYSAANRFNEADQALRRAAELAKDASPVYVEIGMNAQKANRYPDAIKAFQKALEISPQTGQIHLYLSRAYQRAGDAEAARREEITFRAWEKGNIERVNRKNLGQSPPAPPQ
jgi:tetratricopeptide (TPR) repeat protein